MTGRRRVAAGLALVACLLMLGAVLAAAKTKSGTPKADRIVGTGAADVLRGGRGKDVIRGKGGADRLIGGKHADRLIGGPGRDQINMRNGAEIASPGNDFIRARDGTPDQINCGTGRRDVVKVDRVEEGVFNCEIVRAPRVEGENIG